MIEPSRARALISGLRLCLQSLKRKDTWHDSVYHSDQPLDYENFEAEYGLPEGIDLAASPESAFPPNSDSSSNNNLSSRPERSGAEGPAFLPVGASEMGGPQLPEVGNCGAGAPDIAAETQHIIDVSRGLPVSLEDSVRFGSCVTPLDAEMMEVTRTQGFAAAQKIQDQFEQNGQRRVRRRRSSSDRERYALISMQSNLQSAIERHAARLAVHPAAAKHPIAETDRKPPISVHGDGSAMAQTAELTPTGSIG